MEKGEFKRKVIEIVKSIEYGETLSYSDIAKIAGSPKGHRNVGIIVNYAHLTGIKAPYHRIVRKNGEVGYGKRGRDGDNKEKILMLKKEGHEIIEEHKGHKAKIVKV